MYRTALSLLMLGTVLLIGQAPLQAQMTYSTSDPLGFANTFNSIIFNTASASGGHADGAVAVGGTFTMAYNSVLASGATGTIGSISNIGLYTNNLVVSGSSEVNSGANAYTNTISGQSNLVMNGGTLHSGAGTVSTSNFTSQLTYSQYQSSHLGALTGAAINTTDQNNWSIDTTNTTGPYASTQYGNLKVYTINGSQLGSNVTLNISNLMANQTIDINVVGDVNNFGVSVNGATGSQLIWNFLTTQSSQAGTTGDVYINNRSLTGTVLAPNASVYQSQNINGILIASNWYVSGSAEVHYTSSTTFSDTNGNLRPYSPLAAAPEPGAVGLLIGLGLSTGVAVRRRRKK